MRKTLSSYCTDCGKSVVVERVRDAVPLGGKARQPTTGVQITALLECGHGKSFVTSAARWAEYR
jgi:hypothetical protein